MSVSFRMGLRPQAGSGDELGTAWGSFTRSVGEFLGSAVHSSAWWIPGIVLVLVVLVVVRRYLLHSKLGQRVTVELKPSEEFEASLDQVLKIAKRWSRVRPSGHRLINWWQGPAGAHALRVSLLSDEDGLLRYRLTAPRAAANLLTSSGYAAVETRVVNSATGDDDEIPTMASWREAMGYRPPAPSSASHHGGAGQRAAGTAPTAAERDEEQP